MKFTRRLIATTAVALTLVGVAAPAAQAYQEGTFTLRYALQTETFGSGMETLKARNCLTEDDWGAGTRLVRFDRVNSVIVIRCRRH